MNYIGMDVDSKYLVGQIQRGEKRFPIARFDNNPPGHKNFITWATKCHQPVPVVMDKQQESIHCRLCWHYMKWWALKSQS